MRIRISALKMKIESDGDCSRAGSPVAFDYVWRPSNPDAYRTFSGLLSPNFLTNEAVSRPSEQIRPVHIINPQRPSRERLAALLQDEYAVSVSDLLDWRTLLAKLHRCRLLIIDDAALDGTRTLRCMARSGLAIRPSCSSPLPVTRTMRSRR